MSLEGPARRIAIVGALVASRVPVAVGVTLMALRSRPGQYPRRAGQPPSEVVLAPAQIGAALATLAAAASVPSERRGRPGPPSACASRPPATARSRGARAPCHRDRDRRAPAPAARRVDRAHPPSPSRRELLRLLADAQSREWVLDRLIDEVTVKGTYFFATRRSSSRFPGDRICASGTERALASRICGRWAKAASRSRMLPAIGCDSRATTSSPTRPRRLAPLPSTRSSVATSSSTLTSRSLGGGSSAAKRTLCAQPAVRARSSSATRGVAREPR